LSSGYVFVTLIKQKARGAASQLYGKRDLKINNVTRDQYSTNINKNYCCRIAINLFNFLLFLFIKCLKGLLVGWKEVVTIKDYICCQSVLPSHSFFFPTPTKTKRNVYFQHIYAQSFYKRKQEWCKRCMNDCEAWKKDSLSEQKNFFLWSIVNFFS
jgi:hypothetical protein